MSARNDGGSAFPMQDGQAIHAYAAGRVADIPSEETDRRDREYTKARANAVGGMTLRDYFAAKAMQAWQSNRSPDDSSIEHVAGWSYRMADAMLRARDGAQ